MVNVTPVAIVCEVAGFDIANSTQLNSFFEEFSNMDVELWHRDDHDTLLVHIGVGEAGEYLARLPHMIKRLSGEIRVLRLTVLDL